MELQRMAMNRMRLGPIATDGLIVVGLLVAGSLQAWPGYLPRLSGASQGELLGYLAPFAITLAVALPLAWRRTFPLVTAAVVAIAFSISELATSEMSGALIALFAALYSVGRYASPRIASLIALLGVVAVEASVALIEDGPSVWLVFLITVTIALWIVGDATQQHEDRAALLEELAARHEAERQAASARAADAERARIARELHDVIAHDVTVMVVQASAAGRILDRDPVEARRSLAAIETTGRLALAEMRRLLGALHHDDGPPPNEPQPSLTGLPRLVDNMRASGLAVDLAIVGRVRNASSAVDLSAYRIVQEALTNALRHGENGRTHVSVAYNDRVLEIDVTTERPPAGSRSIPPSSANGGRGLAGMRERVALVHGELNAGPEPGGGFRVRARLPLAES